MAALYWCKSPRERRAHGYFRALMVFQSGSGNSNPVLIAAAWMGLKNRLRAGQPLGQRADLLADVGNGDGFPQRSDCQGPDGEYLL